MNPPEDPGCHETAVAFIRSRTEPPKPFTDLPSLNPGTCEVCRRARDYAWARDLRERGGLRFQGDMDLAEADLRLAVEFYTSRRLGCVPHRADTMGPVPRKD